MKEIEQFRKTRLFNHKNMIADSDLTNLSLKFLCDSSKYNYSYNFDWLGMPIIQYPQDIVSFQEIVWSVKPDLIIEFGIARGGSLIYSASLLALIEIYKNGSFTTTKKNINERKVLGVDIDIREHNKIELLKHPFSKNIDMIEGSSIDIVTIKKVHEYAKNFKNILISMDSNHTHDHVLQELNAYAELTTTGSYCLVYDTVIDDMPHELNKNREWGPENSPKSAVKSFLKNNNKFIIDDYFQNKSLITSAPDGFLKKIK